MGRRRGENSFSYLRRDQIVFICSGPGGNDLPIAMTYILVEKSDDAFSTSRLEEAGDCEQDSIQHSIGERGIPVAEHLLLGSKSLCVSR